MPKNVQTTTHLHSFYMQQGNAQNPSVRLQNKWTENFQMCKLDSKKAGDWLAKAEKAIKFPASIWS